LLDQKFDLVFFTGSQSVGKEVLLKCSKHLTPACYAPQKCNLKKESCKSKNNKRLAIASLLIL